MEDEAGMAGLSLSVKHKRQFYYFMTGVKKRFDFTAEKLCRFPI